MKVQNFQWITLVAALVSCVLGAPGSTKCQARWYGEDACVCVCDADHCDQVPDFPDVTKDEVAVFTSDTSVRFVETNLKWKREKSFLNPDTKIYIRTNQTYQEIWGIGGAFTDAMGINVASLTQDVQEKLLKSYFGPNSAQYSFGRVPIASCDFSTRNYSYDDTPGDFDLKHFALAEEDIKYKIPMMKAAQKLSDHPIKLFGSPWSAPAWMKTNDDMTGAGWLIGRSGNKYHKTWANYYIKFLEAYAKHNLTYWGLTVQNEPTTGFVPGYKWQTMGYTPAMMRDFIVNELGPKLRASEFADTKLMINDDQRLFVEWNADTILNDPAAAQYVDGIAVHWYMDRLLPESLFHVLLDVHDKHPDRFLMNTEACVEDPQDAAQPLGRWSQAQHYAYSIMEDLNAWATAWVDWNMALDEQGGPNWVGNYVNSPIIVNTTANEFYKQPMYYVLAHFSAFIAPHSVRVYSEVQPMRDTDVKSLAAVTPSNHTVLVLLNRNEFRHKKVQVNTLDRPDHLLNIKLNPKSITTVVWNNNQEN